MQNFHNLQFDNTAINQLPLDPITENYPRKVNACFSIVKPTPILNPKLVHWSPRALQLLDLNLNEIKKPDIANYLSGNQLLPGSQPIAHCYCGHQFGQFAGQLGDGRAISLGEIINRKGERWEIQLKGSGKTPYSRQADGRAVLRSSIREFLCSEAMHHLGIPTTRAATLITSDTPVERDVRYDGNTIIEKATVVSRIAPTFIRFGSFQIADPPDSLTGQSGPSFGNPEIIRQLTNYVIRYHYPHIFKDHPSKEQRVVAFAEELMVKTAKMVALWQCCGFTHGVLNTDNMSIAGLTIDYGPFGFLDNYDPDFISNASDKEGRYKFKNQPAMCKWNLQKLFISLGLAFPQIKSQLDIISENFCTEYHVNYMTKMRKKLGLFKARADDYKLVQSLLDTMQETHGDFTNIFRNLSQFSLSTLAVDNDPILPLILKQTRNNTPYQRQGELWIEWLKVYKARLEYDFSSQTDNFNEWQSRRLYMMNHNNPRYILRNYLAQQAIKQAESGNYEEVKRLFHLLSDPYDQSGKYREYEYDKLPPQWTTKLTLTCSS